MVRRRRDAVTPDAVGLPPGTRRRAPGLRREELAGLAGISADYLTRLERGRATTPSTQVTAALARALRLDGEDRDLLYRLAGHAPPGSDVVPRHLPPSVQRLLDRLAGTPVAVYDAAQTLIVANAPYDALMGPTSTWRGVERNALWRHLVGPGSRVVHTPHEEDSLVASLVADLRLAVTRYPADPDLTVLVRELTDRSPRFVELWENESPRSPGETMRHKLVDHPAVGRIAVDCDALVITGDDLRLLVYSAEPGTEDAERLALAVVLGTQEPAGHDRGEPVSPPSPPRPARSGR